MAGGFCSHFQSWLNFNIGVEPFLGTYDGYGQEQRGGVVLMPCFPEEKTRLVRDLAGKEVPSTTTLYIAGGPISPHDRITMYSTFRGHANPPIINVGNYYDVSGDFDHSEVYI